MSTCGSKTHRLRTSRLGSVVTSEWIRLSDGQVETDAAVLAQLAALLAEDPNCFKGGVDCVESQEWTYGIDNTGTNYADTATYLITLSDGATIEYEQTPTSSWTQQLQMWAASIQTAADNAGLAWFVEPRAVNNPNPSDISGNYGSTPTGLPGAPSAAIAQGLIDGGMAARYVNIQICPSQPVPVRAERLTSATYTNNPYTLNTAGAILGPLVKFFVCRSCGEEPVWFLDDGVTEASAGQIPNCWVPCGTLSLTASPPEKDCVFQTELACDNNNSNLTVDYTPDITRRATICNGEQIAVDYFQADPGDASALIPYTLVGNFVDCNTGEVLPEPVAPCTEFEIVKLFRTPTNADGVFTSREWHDTAPAIALTTGVRTAEGAAFRENHDFSLPVDTQGTQTSFVLNDTNNTAAELDIQVVDGYIYVTEPTYIRYATASEGYAAIELGQCCGDLELKSEYGAFGYETPSVLLPVGGHQIRMWNIDSAGSNSSLTLQYSYDDATWVSDNTPPNITISSTPLKEECVTVRVCEDNLAAFDMITGESLDITDFYTCSVGCETPTTGSGTGGNVTVDNFPDQCEDNDTPLTTVTGSNNSIPAGFKSVTINNINGTTTINGGFALGAGRRIDSISFGTDRGNCVNELLPAYTLTGGTWQWIGHRE